MTLVSCSDWGSAIYKTHGNLTNVALGQQLQTVQQMNDSDWLLVRHVVPNSLQHRVLEQSSCVWLIS